ncbi:UNVERIFIED_CONTAM: hypothetical protein Slati_2883100 [Sesamum latifolium]|uniref:Uncharacterized protein n=1 Tax=Sesamum latifolium TaxID=2727402 RepID=A0AAW2VD95_9LAMI
MEIPSNPANKRSAVETSGNTQALTSTSASGGSTPAASAPRIPAPGVVGPVADPPRRSTSSNTSTEELSLALLEQFIR